MININIVLIIIGLIFPSTGCTPLSPNEIRDQMRPLVRLNPYTGMYEPIRRVPDFNYEKDGWMTIIPWENSNDPYGFCGKCHDTGLLKHLDYYRRAGMWGDAAEIKGIIITNQRGNKPYKKAISAHGGRVMQSIPNIVPRN